MGLLFTRKNGDFGAISLTEQSCAAPISNINIAAMTSYEKNVLYSPPFLSRKRESQVVYTQVDVKLLNPSLIGIFSIK